MEELTEKIEKDYLNILVTLLRNGDIDARTGKQITREFMDLVPFTSIDDLQSKIKRFSETHKFFKNLYIDLLKYEEEKKTHELVREMRSHIKENRIDEALRLVK